ncbi:unnamed protein product [Caenorhabditis auriculariae]|uniref:Uncharacterized protein n=1 Tax=Caenorhabditis auriculariae TaxID=2777116 RepID=A0A8S1HB09_9PELO|nr:unnamed protein product [Caenorhabditis auriculariae]
MTANVHREAFLKRFVMECKANSAKMAKLLEEEESELSKLKTQTKANESRLIAAREEKARAIEKNKMLALEKKSADRELSEKKEFYKKSTAKVNQLYAEIARIDEEIKKLIEKDTETISDDFCQVQASIIGKMKQMTITRRNTEVDGLNTTLSELSRTEEKLLKSIADLETKIHEKDDFLAATLGVSYVERNVLFYSLRHATSLIRSEYQKMKLVEQSLRTKLNCSD